VLEVLASGLHIAAQKVDPKRVSFKKMQRLSPPVRKSLVLADEEVPAAGRRKNFLLRNSSSLPASLKPVFFSSDSYSSPAQTLGKRS
jgi:hypothetical protein